MYTLYDLMFLCYKVRTNIQSMNVRFVFQYQLYFVYVWFECNSFIDRSVLRVRTSEIVACKFWYNGVSVPACRFWYNGVSVPTFPSPLDDSDKYKKLFLLSMPSFTIRSSNNWSAEIKMLDIYYFYGSKLEAASFVGFRVSNKEMTPSILSFPFLKMIYQKCLVSSFSFCNLMRTYFIHISFSPVPVLHTSSTVVLLIFSRATPPYFGVRPDPFCE